MIRAGELVVRLAAFSDDPGRLAPSTEGPTLCKEAVEVIQDLMDEIQRRDIREDHARRKADELVGWLNGRWG